MLFTNIDTPSCVISKAVFLNNILGPVKTVIWQVFLVSRLGLRDDQQQKSSYLATKRTEQDLSLMKVFLSVNIDINLFFLVID